MILVVAIVRLHPGRALENEAAVSRIMPRGRAGNPGILFYHAARCRETSDTYRVIEAYADQAAMDRHMATASLQASLGELMPLIADIEIKLHDVVA